MLRYMHTQTVLSLQRAVLSVNGQTALAKLLTSATGKNIRQGHIWSWLNRTKQVPAEYVLPIERVTGGQVSRHELRPDLYPIEPRKTRKRAAA